MKNTGLIVENKIKDYIFLSSESRVDNEIRILDGNWTEYLPANEYQKKGELDTYNCVAFSACNVLEIFFSYLIIEKKISNSGYEWLVNNKYIENGKINFSDRFVGKNAGTSIPEGNTGSRVANAIYNYGLVPESVWSFEYGMDEKDYYSEIPTSVKNLGLEFLSKFKIQFESVYAINFEEALKYSPVQVYVNAWHIKNGVYFNPTHTVNHAVARYRNITKQILDHYDPFIKTLTNDYYYFPSGYKYSVVEIITPMNVEEFLKENDLLFVRNTKTGQFGRIMQKKLKIVNSDDRGTLMLLDDAVRKNGRGISDDEWNQLPSEEF